MEGYQQALIERLNYKYEPQIKIARAVEKIRDLIYSLGEQLDEVLEVSNGNVEILDEENFASIRIGEETLMFEFHEDKIFVKKTGSENVNIDCLTSNYSAFHRNEKPEIKSDNYQLFNLDESSSWDSLFEQYLFKAFESNS